MPMFNAAVDCVKRYEDNLKFGEITSESGQKGKPQNNHNNQNQNTQRNSGNGYRGRHNYEQAAAVDVTSAINPIANGKRNALYNVEVPKGGPSPKYVQVPAQNGQQPYTREYVAVRTAAAVCNTCHGATPQCCGQSANGKWCFAPFCYICKMFGHQPNFCLQSTNINGTKLSVDLPKK